MIAHLRGPILTKSPNQVTVECAGVGYDVIISVATYSALPPEGAETRLHIHTHVREDQIALFGFSEIAEKRLFEKLLTISGIGPKLAITVLSGIDAARLVTAIRAADHASLTRIPGIGKKTAERVVLELKDKLDDLAAATGNTLRPPAPPPSAPSAKTPSQRSSTSATSAPSPSAPSSPHSPNNPRPPKTSNTSSAPRWPPSADRHPKQRPPPKERPLHNPPT